MYLSKSFPWQTSRNRLQRSRTEEINVPTWTEFFIINPNYKKGPDGKLLNQMADRTVLRFFVKRTNVSV